MFILASTICDGGYCGRVAKNNVDIDKKTLLHHINYVLGVHEELFNEMVACLSPDDLLDVFCKMNVNNFGRAVAYLTLVYLMNIPEDAKREDVKREESLYRRMLSGIRRVFAI